MKINSLGHLEIGGCDLCSLAPLSPHPLYLIDEPLLRANMRAYRLGLQRHYGPNSAVYYASKALINLALCRIARQEEIGLDVSSGGELATALQADFPSSQMIFHGNNKSAEELKLSLESGISRIVVDSLHEIELLESLCAATQRPCQLLVRVKPGIYANTHHYIMTGGEDSKFGLKIAEATEAIKLIHKSPWLRFKGVHCHIGSQIHNLESYEKTIEVMAHFCADLHLQGYVVEDFDFGGGLGVAYTPEDQPIPIDLYCQTIATKIIQEFTRHKLPLPRLMVEPGRSIVGEAGTTLYRIGALKPTGDNRLDVAVNGGMADNIRPALYQAKYHALLVNRMDAQPDCTVRLVGKCCESSDILIDQIALPRPRAGDLLALLSTGAYNYSMASNYNRLPIPGMLLLNAGSYDWIVKPQQERDIAYNDLIPSRL
jgi:diaminopimelate decarboxylase